MVKLLIIADDFTGALDTGIQFVNKGIATQVFTKMPEAIGDIDETTEVLVIDSETRPMPAAKAYDAVKNITGWAKLTTYRDSFLKKVYSGRIRLNR